MPPILPMFFLEGVCFEALAFPFMLSISEKTEPAELTVAPPGRDTMRGLVEGSTTVVGSPSHWFHVYFPARKPTADLDVLVAGCGTDLAAQLAASSGSHITAIDSRSDALQQATRQKQGCRLENLKIVELPLEEVSSLGGDFDLIFSPADPCYRPDPSGSLRLLKNVLRRDGSINLTLLAPYGRRGMQTIREILRRLRSPSRAQGAEMARQVLSLMSRDAAKGPQKEQTRAWINDPAMLDAVLLPEETSFDVPALDKLLEQSGLRLQRFLYQAHYFLECSRLAAFPDLLAEVQRLPELEQFAVAELYRGSMATHEVVVCRDDRPTASWRVGFDGSDWPRYVPIRNPGLGISEQNLPAKAVARLHWESHTFPEINVLVDSLQARLFNAVDGCRTIAQVVSHAGAEFDEPAAREYARNFFRSMWVFDYFWFRTACRSEDTHTAVGKVTEGHA